MLLQSLKLETEFIQETNRNMEELKNYKRSDIINVLADLNILVTTFARIGSNFPNDRERILVQEMFMRDIKIFQKLSRAKSILSVPFSRELGEDEMEELERELAHLKRWELPTKEVLAKFEKKIMK